jgi:hypothetical protein
MHATLSPALASVESNSSFVANSLHGIWTGFATKAPLQMGALCEDKGGKPVQSHEPVPCHLFVDPPRTALGRHGGPGIDYQLAGSWMQSLQRDESEVVCSICLEQFTDKVDTLCGHSFCRCS